MHPTAHLPTVPPSRRRLSPRLLLGVGVAIMVVVAVVLAITLPGGSDNPGLAAGAGSTSGAAATDSGTAGPSPSGSGVPGSTGSASASATAGAASSKPGVATSGGSQGGGSGASAPPVAAANGKSWALSFDEEFNGSSLDTSKLSPCFDWNYGDCTNTFNNGREHYQPSQVVVSNGTAKLIAAPLSPAIQSSSCQNGSCTYKSGLLSTARPTGNSPNYLYKFTYGYVEARMKMPTTPGFFTAFWMLPANPSFTYDTEIDILEFLGSDPRMFMTYHYNGRNTSYPIVNGACQNYAGDFVRMGVDWEPDHIAWYINGVKCGQTTTGIANTPMQLILNLMVDVDWQRQAAFNDGLKDPTLSRQLEVDYLRVYQQR